MKRFGAGATIATLNRIQAAFFNTMSEWTKVLGKTQGFISLPKGPS
jgi:hypothetical protein